MKDVIIPLAAETNAVILGCCNQGECFLTRECVPNSLQGGPQLPSDKLTPGDPAYFGGSPEICWSPLNEYASRCPPKMFIAEAFLDALSVERAKWGGKLPFSFLGLGAEMKNLYLYKSENAHWRQVRRASHHWRSRDKLILDIVGKLGMFVSVCPRV